MTAPDRPPLERQRYWQGQTLLSRDFNDELAHEAQRRWWHNRSLHNAFGVVDGLAVVVPDTAAPDDDGRQILDVLEGLAYDAHGREIYLREAVEVRTPPLSDRPKNWTLLIRNPEPSGSDFGVPSKDGIGIAQPEFRWVASSRVELTDGVPLAWWQNTATAGSLQGRVQNTAKHKNGAGSSSMRAHSSARVRSGTSLLGKTDWKVSRTNLNNNQKIARLEADINTSAAGFRSVPCYFAWVNTESLQTLVSRFLDSFSAVKPGAEPPESINLTLALLHADALLSLFLGEISHSAETGFRLSVRFPYGDDLEIVRAVSKGLYVGWLGVEDGSQSHPASEDDHDCDC